MKLIGRDRCTIPSERTSYVRLMCIQFRLCVSNIFYKCSECYRVRGPRLKNHAAVQKSCSSGRSSGRSAFHSSKYRNFILLTRMKDNAHHCNLAGTLGNLSIDPLSTFWQ